MKKKLKSILSAILALAMIACMAVPAFAEGNIIIYNNGSAPQQGQLGPGPGPGPQGSPQQGPGPAPQGPAPKSNSNYDYAVLKGNTEPYHNNTSLTLDFYTHIWGSFDKPVDGKITYTIGSLQHSENGLWAQVYVLNGLKKSITVKRLDHVLIMKDGTVIAKVPHQLLDKSVKIKAGGNETVAFTIDPQYFNHDAKLSGGTYTFEADAIYD